MAQTLRDNTETTLEELSLHPADVWNHYAPQIIANAITLIGKAPMREPTQTNYRRAVSEKTDAWF
jgi:hypothetical protein